MKSVVISLLIISLSFFSTQVQSVSVVTSYANTASDLNPICTNKGTFRYPSSDLLAYGSKGLEVDYISTYYDSQGSSSPLMITFAVGTSSFKFTTYTNNSFTTTQQCTCTGTSKTQFVDTIANYLFINDNGTYKMCKFDPLAPTTDVTPKTLNLAAAGLTNQPNIFTPYFQDSGFVYVGVTDGTDSSILKFDFTSATAEQTTINGVLATASKFANLALTQTHGNDKLYYNPTSKDFLKFSDGLSASGSDKPNSAYTVVKSYPLRTYMIITASESTLLSGAIYRVKGENVVKLPYADATTTAFVDYNDGFSNFARVGTTSMYWITQSASNIDSFYTSTIPVSQFNFGATGSLESVSLSGDKAVLLWQNKALYLKHVGDNQVKKITQSFENTLTFGNEYEYLMKISCFCHKIKQFICASGTLNCLIAKKGTSQCGGTDPFIKLE